MSKNLFIKGIFFSYTRQILQLILGIASLPLMLNYFGTVNYSILALTFGLSEYLALVSFGIPAAMVTLVANASDAKQKCLILHKSAKALFIISIMSILLFLAVITTGDQWIVYFLGNIGNESEELAKTVFIYFTLGTLAKIPISLFVNFFRGMNDTYISEIYQILFLLFNFLSLLIAVYFKLNLVNYIKIIFMLMITVSVIAVIHVNIKYDYLFSVTQCIKEVSYISIFKSSFSFFQVGLSVAIIWGTDNLVISHFLSVQEITPYAIAFKIFMYTFMFSAIINGVISPMYGMAQANNDWNKIRNYTMLIHKILPTFGALVWISFILFGKEIIIFWTHKEEAFGGYLLMFSLGLYGYIVSFVNTYSTLVNSLNFAQKSLKIVWGEALLNFILSILLVQFFNIGGVALATALASFMVSFILFPKLIKKITNEKIVYEYTYARKTFFFFVLPFVMISMLVVRIDVFYKMIIFLFMLFSFLIVGWKLLSQDDRKILLNLFGSKKPNFFWCS